MVVQVLQCQHFVMLCQKKRKKVFVIFKSVKFPYGYALNISGCVSVDDGNIARFRSHDYHVL